MYALYFISLLLIIQVQTRKDCSLPGHYSVSLIDITDIHSTCPETQVPCPPGFYCIDGRREPCPKGTYGLESELRSKDCSGICPSGYYCPESTIHPIPCGGTNVYCPLGSYNPNLVPPGYYSTGLSTKLADTIHLCPLGYYCVNGIKNLCPAGRYGTTTGLADVKCTGICPVGFYCPIGSINPIICPAGKYSSRTGEFQSTCSGDCEKGYFCPAGSTSARQLPCPLGTYCVGGRDTPQITLPGYFSSDEHPSEQTICPIGYYCTGDGLAMECPSGTFGDRLGLSSATCSGKCPQGFYCPQRTVSKYANPCLQINEYCPIASSKPQIVATGYYTVSEHSNHLLTTEVRVAKRQCEPGNYCINGVKFACPAGTYGLTRGLIIQSCSGICPAGYYCPAKTIVPTSYPCGSSKVYCPEGSAAPVPISYGYCSTGGSSNVVRTGQVPAPIGHFARLGICNMCLGGTFGDKVGETNASCAGVCAPGYFCPPGSSSPTQNECGSAALFCPEGSDAPYLVDIGYYTSRDLEDECPPGLYRDYSSTHPTFMHIITGKSPITVNYGSELYPIAQCRKCPFGRFKSDVGDAITQCIPCPKLTTYSSLDRTTCICYRLPGGEQFDGTKMKLTFNKTDMSCTIGSAQNDKVVKWSTMLTLEKHSHRSRWQQFPCEIGYYCIEGIRRPCPAGYYGLSIRETSPYCTGMCEKGYYCPLASTNSRMFNCGHSQVYCPEGSISPIPVSPGYYTVKVYGKFNVATARDAANRDTQLVCPKGHYCINGQKHVCTGGRYGDKLGETSRLCSGKCKRGFFCPNGSTSPHEIKCGHNAEVVPNTLKTQFFCPTGSSEPTLVATGYYSVGEEIQVGDHGTRFHQRKCEAGYFCAQGIRHPCPAGTYGEEEGLSTSQCSGLCRAGYYCPSSLPDVSPSTSPTRYECGNSTVYCPSGTGNTPLIVESGYYSVGAGDGTCNARNTTRTGQLICPKGYYCNRGIKIRCPEGTYGSEEGMTNVYCSGWCPAGYYCPFATVNYKDNPCPLGTFSTGGSGTCTACSWLNESIKEQLSTNLTAGYLGVIPKCNNGRGCCFLG